MTAPVTTVRLELTGHPVQRCGAWAVTLLAGREHPNEVSTNDLESMAGQLVNDVVRAATAAQGSEHYDWWKVNEAGVTEDTFARRVSDSIAAGETSASHGAAASASAIS
ncbi:MAG TPA: hypothetical protein VFQ77_07850 [Pseudonocardiaceae bacterium]|jgi:CRISPR-associated protein Cst1|nr:hypothetical protein [Pseudonocardiaceae bacterium]